MLLGLSYTDAAFSTVGSFVHPAAGLAGRFAWNTQRWLYHAIRFRKLYEEPHSMKQAFQAAVIMGVGNSVPAADKIIQLVLIGKQISDICDTHERIATLGKRFLALFTDPFHEEYDFKKDRNYWGEDVPMLPPSSARELRRYVHRTETVLRLGTEILKQLGLEVFRLVNQYDDLLQILKGDAITTYVNTTELVKLNDQYLEKLQIYGNELGRTFKKFRAHIERFLSKMQIKEDYSNKVLDNISKTLDKTFTVKEKATTVIQVGVDQTDSFVRRLSGIKSAPSPQKQFDLSSITFHKIKILAKEKTGVGENPNQTGNFPNWTGEAFSKEEQV